VAFHDAHISDVGDHVAMGHYGDPDVAVVEAVAVGEDWLVPSTSVGHTPTFVRAADRLIVEVNEAQPLALAALHDTTSRPLPPDREPLTHETPGERVGDARIRFDPEKLVAVVRSDRPDDPYEFREPTRTDEAIASNLAAFLAEEVEHNPVFRDRVCLQFGVGSLGNALMGAFRDVDLGRPVAYFGEVVQDGLLDMLDAGALTAASATSLALSREGQERLFADPARYADRVVVRSADVSNAPSLVDRFGVVGVNSALEVGLYGHANATHLRGTHLVNGVGGGGDFERASALGVVALGSTAADGDVSRVVPMVPHVDHTAHDLSVVVTEHGVADLRGLGGSERAREMVSVAHPDFRPELRAYLDRADGGALPHDHATALDSYVDDGE
jgi:succinyl-CoA:acetate CoA-transferase